MVERQIAVVAEHLVGVIFAAVLQQPRRRLLEERNADGEKTSGHELERHRYAPSCAASRCNVVDDAIVDPKSNDGTDLVERLEESRQTTTYSRRADLSDVDRANSGDTSHSQAS